MARRSRNLTGESVMRDTNACLSGQWPKLRYEGRANGKDDSDVGKLGHVGQKRGHVFAPKSDTFALVDGVDKNQRTTSSRFTRRVKRAKKLVAATGEAEQLERVGPRFGAIETFGEQKYH